jgi:hypothetical protein
MFRYLALATCVVLAWEGGICFDHIDDISNNYQFRAGVRVRF